jgi:hypothetical protein
MEHKNVQEFLPNNSDFDRFLMEARANNEVITRLENGFITLNINREQIKITPRALIELLTDKFRCPLELPTYVSLPLPKQPSPFNSYSTDEKTEQMKTAYNQLLAVRNTQDVLPCGDYYGSYSYSRSCPLLYRIRFLEWERLLIQAYIDAAKQELQTKKESEIVTIKKEYEERLEVEKTELKETVNLREKEIRGRIEYEQQGEAQNKYQVERIRELSKNVEVTHEKKIDVEKQLSALQIEHTNQTINIDKLKQELNQAQKKIQKVTKERDDARRKVLVQPTKTAPRHTSQPDTNQEIIIDLITDSEGGLTFEEIANQISMLENDLHQLLGIMVQNGEIHVDERGGEILRYIPP